MKNLKTFEDLKIPLLLGASRKRFINDILGNTDTMDRLEGSLAALAIGTFNKVNIFRVHDVKESKKFLTVFNSILKS